MKLHACQAPCPHHSKVSKDGDPERRERKDVKKPDSMIWLNNTFNICDVPSINIMETGGKCKFRTCDPCSVNAVLYP